MNAMRTKPVPPNQGVTRTLRVLLCAVSTVLGGGCAAFTNPVANGIPVLLMPPELLAESKEDLIPVPMSALRKSPSDTYLLGPGDVLSVYIGRILGPPAGASMARSTDPYEGFSIPVREDGTVMLPLIAPIPVAGLSIADAKKSIVNTYTVENKLLAEGRELVLVSLKQTRRVRVFVIRSESLRYPSVARGAPLAGVLGRLTPPLGPIGDAAGMAVDLPAYENDLLTALSLTGGLPGDNAHEIVIQRSHVNATDVAQDLESQPMGAILRIPLQLRVGDGLPFKPEDVILQPGDVVLVQPRASGRFYSGGLLPPGEYMLPPDRDLSVVQAIAQIGGPLVNGGLNSNNLSGSVISGGIGGPSPSRLSVLRQTPNGKRMAIQVDLNRALNDPREDLLLQAGDIMILQQTPLEAFVRHVAGILSFGLTSPVITGSTGTGT